MNVVLTIGVGSFLGIVGALPSAYLFEQALRKVRPVSVASGLASILASYIMLCVAVFVVWLVSRENALPFGVAEAVSFLLVWAIEAWRGWHDAQRGVGSGERKRGESTRRSQRGDGRTR